jgi:hypothetical protein
MRKFIHLLLLLFLLAGCNTLLLKPKLDPTPTIVPSTQCAWNWATQALPELSAKVEADMQAAGLKGITARAEAYGENCVITGGKVDHFATMETDFRLSVQVGNLKDTDDLGSLLERILVVLERFPTGSIPGPNPGFIGVSFQKGSEQLNLWFPVTTGRSVLAKGYHGAALFEELQKK